MTNTSDTAAPVLQMTGIDKAFAGVKALDNVDFRLRPGEVHALLGENGAGKSTLLKVLTGAYEIDNGTIELKGERVLFASPLEAQRGGVSAVYQEVNLCPNLSVAENIYIGREPRSKGRIQWRVMRRQAVEALARVDVHADVSGLLSTHSLAVQQMVAIARAIDISADVLILDEPTSSLDTGEVERLFEVIRQLTSQGIAVVFVSHFLDQVFEIADRITVLRNGKLVGEWPKAELSRVELVSQMLGREYKTLEALERKSREALDSLESTTPVLQAEAVGRKKAIAPCDLALHRGEVVGLAGLLGSGRTELARLLFGADRSDSGHLLLDGKRVSIRNPRVATANGVAFCPENRRTEGLVEDLTVRENILLALQAARGWTRPIPRKRQEELAEHWIRALDIRVANAEQPMRSLSGGNQQKVLLARWLLTQPKLLILDEPTRGIDVGAKTEIQRLVVSLCDDGMAVLFISAEIEEVLRLSHKVEVLRDRQLVAELANDEDVTLDTLVHTIAGGAAA
ncbi:MAG TPA: sugar ABC transporter ATP-binding protein [Gaiellaceae bacterium]